MTLTMEGPGLPTTKEGQCGTYLIVEEAGESAASFVGYGAGILVLFLHVTLGIMMFLVR